MRLTTVCLYTTTRGHWDRKDIYKKTVEGFLAQCPAEYWGGLIAHIKLAMNKDEDAQAEEMKKWLEERGFKVLLTYGDWKHGSDSHQTEYLNDMKRVSAEVTTEYVFHLEDDWELKAYKDDVKLYSCLAEIWLRNNTNITQVRIPRFSNEYERINKLKAKHGLDVRAMRIGAPTAYFRSGDWSNNPYFARTRDIRAALTFVENSNAPKHSEHGLGMAMKMLSWDGLNVPFICFEPSLIRCGHLGTPAGQEDDLSKELTSD